ncbi:MAG TPA: carboxypeptidase regulatory-like domain-containing protein [Bacteroidota bacterium]|nr:carboxypeptidase regulatory-like domain-containing protein [Bacteroidota bacterium]
MTSALPQLIVGLAFILCFGSSPDKVVASSPAPERPPQERPGSITGKVEIHASSQLIRMERGGRYHAAMAGHESEAAAENSSEQRNVVIYLEGDKLEEGSSAHQAETKMDQKNATFIPHVLPIQKGTSVNFVNHDRVYHNVFSLSATKKFNIGRRPTGEGVPIKFDKQGVAQIFCDIHSQMTAFVVVLDNPYFVQPDDDGSFRIDNVPAGTYTIKVWHERMTSPEQKVTVSPGGSAKVNFILE